MSFDDNLNEYATTKIVNKSSYSQLENVLFLEQNVPVTTTLAEIYKFYSAVKGEATLGFAKLNSINNFEFEILDNGSPISVTFSSASNWKYFTLTLKIGHVYTVKAKNNSSASTVDICLNGTISDDISFFIKKV